MLTLAGHFAFQYQRDAETLYQDALAGRYDWEKGEAR